MLKNEKITDLIEQLKTTKVPGGGSLCAITGAEASALGIMSLRLCKGYKNYPVDTVKMIENEIDLLLDHADEDMDNFNKALKNRFSSESDFVLCAKAPREVFASISAVQGLLISEMEKIFKNGDATPGGVNDFICAMEILFSSSSAAIKNIEINYDSMNKGVDEFLNLQNEMKRRYESLIDEILS